MLTSDDIKLLIEAEKEVFPSKEDFEDLRKDFSKLQNAVSSFATGTKENADEIKVVNSRVTNQEEWIKQAADKIGVDYKV